MAADVSSFDDDNAPIAAINVTPFVDVVLVLLVIFMITAPVLLKDAIAIHLPRAGSVSEKTAATLGVLITKQGQILLNGQPLTEEALDKAVREALASHPDAQAIIAADQDARHGDVVHAIDLIKTAGLSRFAVQIERAVR